MSTQNDVQNLTNHSYDGIKEYDNPLPGWWTWIFIATIVFSVFYYVWFHFGAENRSMLDQYESAKNLMLKKQFEEMGELTATRATIAKYMTDEKWVSFGEGTFKTHCQSCHGPDAGGIVGPNLTDTQWKNVKHLEDIGKVINEGAGGAAMPAWKNRLHPNEVVMVSAYVAARLGKPAANPKAPDGSNKIESWDEDVKSVAEELINLSAPKADAKTNPADKANPK
jgi:cytochrome c oxidase cbb3-type subunit III